MKQKNKKYFESFLNHVCEVKWLDASCETKEKTINLDHILPQSLLVSTLTYGIIYKIDDIALIILQEKSEDECDYTVIPLSCIINIKELN